MAQIGIGLDFGNSNTTLAFFDGEQIRYHPLEDQAEIMPSTLYINKAYESFRGKGALNRYLEDNRGRKVQLARKAVGQVEVHMGEMDRDYFENRDRSFSAIVHGYIDRELPGRLFASLKGYLGDQRDWRFDIFQKSFRLESLITILLNPVEEAVSQGSSLVLGRPVVYPGDTEQTNSRAIQRMNRALHYAGLEGVKYAYEPIGAAQSYFYQTDLDLGSLVFVFDFGGGTLDLSLIEKTQKGFCILGTAGLAKAGDYIDRLLMEKFLLPHLGKGIWINREGGKEYKFPFGEYQDHLMNWQSTFLLNQSKYLEPLLDAIRHDGSSREILDRLYKTIIQNASFTLLKKMEQAKVDLSSQLETVIQLEEIGMDFVLTRKELEDDLQPLLGEIEEKVAALFKAARKEYRQVNKVVCTGGSSQIPLMQNWLHHLFNLSVESYTPFHSIAAGLAILDFHYKNKGERDHFAE